MPPPDRLPSRLHAALAHVSANRRAAVADLARMVAVDTRFPPGAGYTAFAELMEVLLAPLGLATRRVIVPPPLWQTPCGVADGERVNLIAGPRGDVAARDVCGLYFHVDTVPAAADWARDPLCLTQEGDRLYGLGAADMKGTIAAVLLALRTARACDVPLAYDPMLLLCTDEEGGLYPGIRYLAEQGELRGHIVNFNGSASPRIWAGCFGMFNLLVRLHGRTAHAGDPGAAVNAVEAMFPVLRALSELKQTVARRVSMLPPRDPNGAKLAASLTIGAMHGGVSGSQVPARCDLVINRRYAPEEDFTAAHAEIEAVVRDAVAATPGLSVRFALIGHLIPTANPDGPHWPRWQRALSLGFGYEMAVFRKWGSATCSDFGYVQRAGMQEVLLGGLGRPEHNVHAADEYTTLTDLVALAQSVLAYLAADFAPRLIPEQQQASVSC